MDRVLSTVVPRVRLGRLVLALLPVLCWACGESGPVPAVTPQLFVDRAAASGLDHYYCNGMSGQLYLCEIMAPGCALLDYDNDGDLDAFVVQGHMLDPELSPEQATVPPPDALPLQDRLYRNELVGEAGATGRLHFVDVTGESGVLGLGYSMGVATGDIDNDGWIDLYVTSMGANQLWHNNQDGTFNEVAAEVGAGDERWSTSAAFLDFDRDGWLDLYVANYVAYSVAIHQECSGQSGAPDYCSPLAYSAQSDRLLHNRGDGTFADVSFSSGIGRHPANGLGVVTGDLDGDGWVDIYVANDLMQNTLWRNQGDGSFIDIALVAGCAVDSEGGAQSSMGVTAGDYDNDGDEDLFVGHMVRQTSTLYQNLGGWCQTPRLPFGEVSGSPTTHPSQTRRPLHALPPTAPAGSLARRAGRSSPYFEAAQRSQRTGEPARGGAESDTSHLSSGGFRDVTTSSSIGRLSAPLTTYGAMMLDYDNDGWLDILVANGSMVNIDAQMAAGERYPLLEPNQLYRNQADGSFCDLSQRAECLLQPEVSRGLAVGDVDNDGDPDVLIGNSNGRTRLLINQVGQQAHWLGLRLLGSAAPRDMLGAQVTATRSDGLRLIRRVRSDGSYLSAHDPRLLLGLGDSAQPLSVLVEWPGGERESWPDLASDRYHTLIMGSSVPVAAEESNRRSDSLVACAGTGEKQGEPDDG